MNFNPHDPQNLILSDPVKVTEKLRYFAQAGPERIYYLFDFDRTLTTSKHTGDNTTTWQILHGLLSEEGRKISDAVRDKYLKMEDEGRLTQEDAHTFSTTLLDLHATHGTNRRDMEQAATQVRLRDGSEALFAACEAARIPTVILSAGIRDIIELIARENNIHPTLLLSIKLQFDDDGRIIGWDKDSMILTNNKNENVKQWVSHIASARPLTVLIGDTLEDAKMVEGEKDVLRIRVCDCAASDDYLQKSWAAGYDIVIEEDLEPLVGLTNWLAASPSEQA
ncbi:MAG TPA: HAD-IB family phosphatase [Candidatus Saccharimonadales bacterium]|nr:HAD-IB family phosphatase [Candidatus Saccharimonadales bacterium]